MVRQLDSCEPGKCSYGGVDLSEWRKEMLEDFEQEWKRQMHGSLEWGWKEQMLEAYRQGGVERTIITSGGDGD